MPEHSRYRPRSGAPASFGLLAALAVMIGAGCTTMNAAPDDAPPDFVSGEQTRRDQLNDGYTELYSSVDGLSQVDRIFYVKIESDDVQRVVENVTGYSGELAARMQRLTEDFPALALDRRIDPPIVKAARDAQKNATLKRFAPVVGASGRAFERGLLIRLLGAVDQQHHMAATLAEREPEPALSKIMANAAERYAGFYDEIDALLNARFYR